MAEYKFYQPWKIHQCGTCPVYNDISEECQLTDRDDYYFEPNYAEEPDDNY